MRGTAGNVSDVVEGNSLLHGQETDAFGDAGYQGAHKRPDVRQDLTWHVAMRPGKRKALDKENNAIDALIDQVEKLKASIRAKVEHPFRVIKRQFGYTKVRYLGLKENTLQLKTLFALSNLWMVRIRPANPSTPNEQLQAPSCPRKPSCTPCLKRFPIRAPVSPARAGSTARNSRLN